MKKLLALLLAALMLLALAACGGTPAETTAPASPVTASPDEAYSPDLPDPETVDIAGTFNILVSANIERNDFHAEGEEGTAVETAIFRRNELLKEKYGVEIVDEDLIEFGSTNGSGTGFKTVYNDYMAGEGLYDAASIGPYDVATLAYGGYLHDLNQTPYVDLTKPYWDQRANADLAVNGRMYYSTGDISHVDNLMTHAILFNKDMIAEYGLEDPYQLVRDDEWTMESYARIAKSVGEDLNQDGIYNEHDRYGILTWNDPTTAILACSGERIASVGEDGLIHLTFYNERVLNLYDRYFDLVFDQAHSYNYQYDNVTGKATLLATWDPNRDAIFNEDRAVFYMTLVETVERHRDSETDFGILPYPKLDENQERFGHAVSAFHSQFVCVPKMAKDYERTGIVLEELAYQGLRLLTPAFYDQTLVGRYVRDEESAEMLDIIYATHVFDLGAYYKIGSYNSKMSQIYVTRTPIASMYETYRVSAERMIDLINQMMQSIEE